MANAISFYVGGKGNRNLKPRNMSTYLIKSLLDADSSAGIQKRMNFEYMGEVINEEIQAHLTQKQFVGLVDEHARRFRK